MDVIIILVSLFQSSMVLILGKAVLYQGFGYVLIYLFTFSLREVPRTFTQFLCFGIEFVFVIS